MKKYRHSASKKPILSSSGIGNWTVLKRNVTPIEPYKVNKGTRVKKATVLSSIKYRQSLKNKYL